MRPLNKCPVFKLSSLHVFKSGVSSVSTPTVVVFIVALIIVVVLSSNIDAYCTVMFPALLGVILRSHLFEFR